MKRRTIERLLRRLKPSVSELAYFVIAMRGCSDKSVQWGEKNSLKWFLLHNVLVHERCKDTYSAMLCDKCGKDSRFTMRTDGHCECGGFFHKVWTKEFLADAPKREKEEQELVKKIAARDERRRKKYKYPDWVVVECDTCREEYEKSVRESRRTQ